MTDVYRYTERLAEELTDVCYLALKAHGVHLEHAGKTWQGVYQVMLTIAQPKEQK